MITIMMMSVAVFVAFWFVPVALFLILPHFNKPHRLTTGAVMMAITAPIALMGIRGFNDDDAIINRVGIGDSDVAMYTR